MSDEIIPVVPVYRNQQHRAAMVKSENCWQDWQVKIMTIEWTLGLKSAAQIGNMINKTRNAVIGKAHRLGLEGGRRSGVNLEPKKPRARKKKVEDTAMAISKPKPPSVVEPFQRLLNRIDSKPPISIGELTDSTCRAPAGTGADGLMTYCGDATFPGKPFCEGHCALFYAPPQPRRGRWN